MTIKLRDAEEQYEEMLNLRWRLANSDDQYINNHAEFVYYNAICTAVSVIGFWERDEHGNHKVSILKMK